jgi:iron(III) transport system ATP-binding protein
MQQGREAPLDRQAYLQVRRASKRFGAFQALDDVSFEMAAGEFVCFLGPSGCGKTTLLRCIAGLETLSAGHVHQAGREITTLPPSARDYGIVFQSYALFPNLTVGDNIGFGLVSLERPAAEVAARVQELLHLVGLAGEEAKYPGQLSGGQQQRVALARALAPSPGLLLLDEPLSALDAKVRGRLRREIKRLQRQVGVTTIMVTHDQEEALTMADRILVMRQGRVEQIGTPDEVYDRPQSSFVADFIGATNLLQATVVGPGRLRSGTLELELELDAGTGHWAPGARVECAIRPEHVTPVPDDASANGSPGRAPEPTVAATVAESERLGGFVRVIALADTDPPEIALDLPEGDPRLAALQPGRAVRLQLPRDKIRLFPAAR